MEPLHNQLWYKVLATYPVGPRIICQYTHIFTNSAQELTPYRFEFKCESNRIRKYFLSMPRFQTGSLGWMTAKLANSATSLHKNICFICVHILCSKFYKQHDNCIFCSALDLILLYTLYLAHNFYEINPWNLITSHVGVSDSHCILITFWKYLFFQSYFENVFLSNSYLELTETNLA
jgi:hypothetical protein